MKSNRILFYQLTIVLFVLLHYTGTIYAQPGSIKYIYTIDYPVEGKEVYLDWVASIVSILQKPDELLSIASYDNYLNESPGRTVEFEFENNLDAAKYFSRPEIREVVDQTIDYGITQDILIINRRGDYDPENIQRRGIKYVYQLDYGVGNRANYINWVKTIVNKLQEPEEIRRIISYDNYFNTSPNRIIEFEFDSMDEAVKYFSFPEINEIVEKSVSMTINHHLSVLELRGDYNKK